MWAGTNCAAAHERVGQLVSAKRAEIAERIRDLELFAAQLDSVKETLERTPPPGACRTDLSCCVPATKGHAPVPVELSPRPSRV